MEIAIVTGASSGMGREFVRQLDGMGLDAIWVIARRIERLEELRQEVTTPLVPMVLDLKRDSAVDLLRERLAGQEPRVRVLVNGAGFGVIGPFTGGELSDQAGMVRLNCEALVAVTYTVLPYMERGGTVIHLASSAGFMPQPEFAVYAATKSFVSSFSQATARELRGRDITVTAVCPGPVRTEFFDVAEKYQPMKRYKKRAMAEPDKVVEKALRDARRGRAVSVYGGTMKLFQVAAKVLPNRLLLAFMR